MTTRSALAERLLRAAENFPGTVALETPGGRTMTYASLLHEAQAIANVLQQHGIGHGKRVALLAPKSIDTIIALLGTLLAGAAYIPIDPASPPARVRFLLDDLDPHALIAHPLLFPSHVPCQQQLAVAGSVGESLGLTVFTGEDHAIDLAFILYTSGSTGQPKGVCITHENAVAFIDWGLQQFQPQPGTRFSSIAPLHFDLSVFDLYVALFSGGTVLLLSESDVKNARFLAQLLSEKNINIAYATPSTWRAVSEFGKPEKFSFSALQHFLFAGEVFYPRHLHAWMNRLPQVRFFNLYGPTETNVSHSQEILFPFDAQRTEPYPIGLPLPGFETFVTDDGELLLNGPQVTPGYWKRDAINAIKFPLVDDQRWYRTGDRVHLDEEGRFVYEGRIDRMIKKRGYRIEPDEVETALLQHPAVLEVAITCAKDKDGYDLLIAHIGTGDKPVYENDLRQHAMTLLPPQLLPDRYRLLGELPKTSSGKIDYQKLNQAQA